MWTAPRRCFATVGVVKNFKQLSMPPIYWNKTAVIVQDRRNFNFRIWNANIAQRPDCPELHKRTYINSSWDLSWIHQQCEISTADEWHVIWLNILIFPPFYVVCDRCVFWEQKISIRNEISLWIWNEQWYQILISCRRSFIFFRVEEWRRINELSMAIDRLARTVSNHCVFLRVIQ